MDASELREQLEQMKAEGPARTDGQVARRWGIGILIVVGLLALVALVIGIVFLIILSGCDYCYS